MKKKIGKTISYAEYKKQAKDLACKGYKSILEKQMKNASLAMSSSDGSICLVRVGKNRFFGYDKF